jgi:hypothetical protein
VKRKATKGFLFARWLLSFDVNLERLSASAPHTDFERHKIGAPVRSGHESHHHLEGCGCRLDGVQLKIFNGKKTISKPSANATLTGFKRFFNH